MPRTYMQRVRTAQLVREVIIGVTGCLLAVVTGAVLSILTKAL